MNGMLRDLLTECAETAHGPDLDLQQLIAKGDRRVGTRRRLAVVGVAAAVALTVGGSLGLLQSGDDAAPPFGPPTTTPTGTESPDTTSGPHPLTYGLGETIHYGDLVIHAAQDADGLFVFDDSLAIVTGADGRLTDTRLYLTDGSEQVEIARGVERVTAGEVGSLLVWLADDDVVIYDVDGRSVVARVPLNGRRLSNPITPLEDAVYWHEYVDDTSTTEGRDYLVRYDVSTGLRTRASRADYEAEARSETPVLVAGSADSTDPAASFTVVDGQLGSDTRSEAPGPVFVAATGAPLRISVPDKYDGVTLNVFQWLDDDRFALVAEDGVKRAPIGDLLECSVSAGRCRTIAAGEQYWLLPGAIGSVGSED